ncbi:Retinol dehydrogenase 14 [Saguinus oedipus]|uniref:Retinol dehydrogenase 14 n=1 Tax=Saguinus oedipus TaxID=9490 RepID=A0ABQ9U4Q6_SAGOE|nr:Retinol dehydrogenase 14 [Saguinus oedipus]
MPHAHQFSAYRWTPGFREGGAVSTAVAVLAALGGALWLAARRFVGSGVQRLRSGGDPGLMHGKTVLITGANSGLGRATAAELLRLGARVIMGCRDRARAEEAAGQLRRELRQALECGPEPGVSGAGELVVRELDLASLRSVRAFCQEMLQVWASGGPGSGGPPWGSGRDLGDR